MESLMGLQGRWVDHYPAHLPGWELSIQGGVQVHLAVAP